MKSNIRDATLRTASVVDCGAITDLFLASRQAAMPYLPLLYSRDETLPWFSEIVLNEAHVLVAVNDKGEVSGFAALLEHTLEHLYVHHDRQGFGIGSSLLNAAKTARPLGFRLNVFQRNSRARRFYERNDFHLVGLRDGSNNEEGEPDAVYEWRPGAC